MQALIPMLIISMLAKIITLGKYVMQRKSIFRICALISSVILIGCKSYSVSVNERVVYTPAPLFSDYTIADPQLATCVAQTIADAHITNAEELKRLNCSNAGIKSLAGLDKFFALEELNLADNQLVDISQIAQLGRLKTVILSGNYLKNVAPLLHLLHLQQLNIDGNKQLVCADLLQLIANTEHKLDISMPSHCEF